jgi:hypothetical protein
MYMITGEGRVIFKVFKELKGWEVYEARSRFALNAGKDACAPVGALSLATGSNLTLRL